MRRSIAIFAVLVSLVVVFASTPALASAVVPPGATFRGHSLAGWQRTYVRWTFGSAQSPIVAGGCGSVVNGVFVMAPAAAPGTTELSCEVPSGVPILALVDVAFSEIPTWGPDDNAVHADAIATYGGLSESAMSVDGSPVSLQGVYRDAGVYDIESIEAGSLYDLICESLTPPCVVDFAAGDTVRLASVGEFALLHPLSAGQHDVSISATFFGTELALHAEVNVG